MEDGVQSKMAPVGRRSFCPALESAPKIFAAEAVPDPLKPKVVVQTDLPQAHMRSNSLETCGNIMAGAPLTHNKRDKNTPTNTKNPTHAPQPHSFLLFGSPPSQIPPPPHL